MSFVDRTLRCVECSTEFVFTAREQQFYAEKGFTHDPKRCPACRALRKSQRAQNNPQWLTDRPVTVSRSGRTMYPVICASCGKQTEVPFEPRLDKPVYCSECYARVRASANRG